LKIKLLLILSSHSLTQILMMLADFHKVWVILVHIILFFVDIAIIKERDKRNGKYLEDQRDHKKIFEETDNNPTNGVG